MKKATKKGTKVIARVRPNAPVSDAERKAIEKELPRLVKEHGELEPAAIVARARDPKNPLHKLPKWSWNMDAATLTRKWDLRVATGYIRVFEVTFEDCPPVRAFPRVRIGKRSRYVPIERALSEEDTTAQLLEQARRQAKVWADNWRTCQVVVEKMAPVFAAIEKVAS